MEHHVVSYGLFFLYELLIYFIGVPVIFLILQKQFHLISRLEIILISICIALIISSLHAMILTFIHLNGIESYIISSGISTIGLNLYLFLVHKKQYTEFFIFLLKPIQRVFDLKIILGVIVVIPLFLIIITPTQEVDSIYVINFLIDWKNNESTPYDSAWHYPSFWELGYLPSLIITNSDVFFWIISLKAVLIIAFSIIIICKRLMLPSYLITLTTISSILFFQYWMLWPTGISTLKNDMIIGAGVLLVGIFLINYKKQIIKYDYLFLILGFIFLGNKYPGILIIILTIILIIIQRKNEFKIKLLLKDKLTYICILFFLITTGHYYIKNIILFNNPIYPVKAAIGEIGFTNSYFDVSGSSILSSINQLEIWQYFLYNNIFKVGFYFPILFLLGIIGLIILLIFSLKFTKLKFLQKYFFLLIFISSTWYLYLGAGWSAGIQENDFSFVVDLGSTRYALGTIALTEIIFIYILYKINIPKNIILGIVFTNIFLRVYFVYSVYAEKFSLSDFYYIGIGIIIILILSKLIIKFSKPLITGIVIIIIFGIIVFSSPQIFEDNRIMQWPWFHSDISSLEKKEIWVVTNPDKNDIWFGIKYPVIGINFQHHVTIVSELEIINLQVENIQNKNPDYIIIMCQPGINCNNEINGIDKTIEDVGYSIVKKTGVSVLWKIN